MTLRLKRPLGWVLLILISAAFQCSSRSPPGKPVIKQCRSPDKETFTCWWEPGANDGENTTYRLLYEKDPSFLNRTNGVLECPDYHTAGENSCFFDKNHTSIWVDYFLTLVAINAFGNTTSDVKKMDVMDIVKPNPPENVTLWLELSEAIPNVHVTWNPYNIGTKSGWITAKYQLRFKKDDTKWNTKNAGVQTHFSLYSAFPGKLYMVQVRCALDNGAWSEWSNTAFIQVPQSESKQQHFWILVSFSAVLFFTAGCMLFIKRKIIKQWLLPPVPGPKIKGVDVQLLKNGRSEEVTSALHAVSVFPSGMSWMNQAEEYLVVCDDNMKLIEDQKHTNVMMISNHIHSKPKINNQLSVVSNVKSKEQAAIFNYCMDVSKSGVNELNYVNTMETKKAFSNDKSNIVNVKPIENNSYVDIQKHEAEIRSMDYSTLREHILFSEKLNSIDTNRQEEILPDDYTRVKEVNRDNRVLLHDPSSRNHAQYTDYSEQMPSHPVTGKVGICAESFNGYVDNIQAATK